MEHDAYHHNVPQQEGRSEACRRVPRLELRLGEGLSVLEEGEVDTVCIAGVGERLGDNDNRREPSVAAPQGLRSSCFLDHLFFFQRISDKIFVGGVPGPPL